MTSENETPQKQEIRIVVVEDVPDDVRNEHDSIMAIAEPKTPEQHHRVVRWYGECDNVKDAKELICECADWTQKRREIQLSDGLLAIIVDLAIYDQKRAGSPVAKNGLGLLQWLHQERRAAPSAGVFRGWGSFEPPIPYIIVVTSVTDATVLESARLSCDELVRKEGPWPDALACALSRAGV